MNCNEFESHIHEYFTNPDFDWWLKRQMDAHYFECKKCYNTFRIAKLLADKEVMVDVEKQMAIGRSPFRESMQKLAKRILELKSKASFGFNLEPLYAVRGGGVKGDRFRAGDSIILQFEPPRSRDGYLIVFHVDNKNNVEIIFPKKAEEASLLRSDEDRSIIMQAPEPKGKHVVKAILMTVKTSEPNPTLPEDKSSVGDLIGTVIDSISDLEEEQWMESVVDFEVV